MKRQDFRFSHRMRVRWVEVDMQKIVFNGHYLMYFDTAVTDYWRRLAMPYADTLRMAGVPVDLEIYRGVIHGFITMGRAIPDALKAHADAGRALKHAFES